MNLGWKTTLAPTGAKPSGTWVTIWSWRDSNHSTNRIVWSGTMSFCAYSSGEG